MDLLVLVCPRGPPKSQITIVETVRKKRPKTRWDPAPPTAPKPIATRDCTRTRRHLMAVRLARWRHRSMVFLRSKNRLWAPKPLKSRPESVPELPSGDLCVKISLSLGNLYFPFIGRKSRHVPSRCHCLSAICAVYGQGPFASLKSALKIDVCCRACSWVSFI